jgi:hypothetical protein
MSRNDDGERQNMRLASAILLVETVLRRRSKRFCRWAIQLTGIAALSLTPASAGAAEASSSVTRQSLQDAWWTGPLLANSANTLPRGHFLLEPYAYDVIGRHSHAFGSLAYIQYGLLDRLTVGMIPVVGYNKVEGSAGSSGIGLGDISLLAQCRLTTFREHRWVPTIGIQVQQTFPTGRYDRLGSRLSDGLGTGAHTTTLALNSQTYFWLPNGRILRMRLNVARSFSDVVGVTDASVYGTTEGFRGHADPAASLLIDAAWEYSLSQRWVLAFDAIYQHSGSTRVSGAQDGTATRLDSGTSWAVGFAPAVEYNVSPNLGVIVGVRVVPAGHNSRTTVAPVMAVNFVR